MGQHNRIAEWLADPVNALGFLNYFAAGCCLLAGLLLDGLPAFAFAVIGTHTILWMGKMP